MGIHLLLPGHGQEGPTLEIIQYTEYRVEAKEGGKRV